MDSTEKHKKTPDISPGLAEAIHPEIGNGAAWEENHHNFLLRHPDPSNVRDNLLQDSVLQNESASQPSLENGSTEPASKTTPAKSVPVAKSAFPKKQVKGVPEKTVTLKPELSETLPISPEPANIPIPEEAKATGKTVKQGKARKKPAKKTKPGPKKAKPGKLVRKVAKTVQRKEEEKSQKAKKSSPRVVAKTPRRKVQPGETGKFASMSNVEKGPAIADQGPVDIVQDPTLSPFTLWLKNLSGSDYVHPYEDDFAIHQARIPGKEGISETYADLLAAQGYKDQAIAMYQKLMEKYPKKSSFFAAKIEALQ